MADHAEYVSLWRLTRFQPPASQLARCGTKDGVSYPVFRKNRLLRLSNTRNRFGPLKVIHVDVFKPDFREIGCPEASFHPHFPEIGLHE